MMPTKSQEHMYRAYRKYAVMRPEKRGTNPNKKEVFCEATGEAFESLTDFANQKKISIQVASRAIINDLPINGNIYKYRK